MDKTGKSLEQLVAAIEEKLMPDGYKVELNKKKFDKNGIQVAEFDIIITGNLGSSSINWLIECRDRPSEGAAPTSWMEQLSGRKKYHAFDKVFAVSTTGFSPGAKQIAETERIVLRHVESVAEIADDWGVFEFRLSQRQVLFNGYCELDIINFSNTENIKSIINNNLAPMKIKGVTDSEYVPFKGFVLNYLDKEKLVPDTDNDGIFNLIFEHSHEVELIYENGEIVKANNLIFPLELHVKYFYPTAISGNLYSESGKLLGQEINFEFDSSLGMLKRSAFIIKLPNGAVNVCLNDDIDSPELR